MKNRILKIGMVLTSFAAWSSCTNESTTDTYSPSSDVRKEYIQTTHDPKNKGVMSTLISDLKVEKFELQKGNFNPLTSFEDADEDVVFVMRGNGMKAYSFKRTEAEPEYYYPDFHLSVFEFKTEREALKGFEKINAALTGRSNKRKKAPSATACNGKEVFYLGTRAEMFRGYIEDCAERIEGYSFSSSPTQ